MSVRSVLKVTERYIISNSPTILTAFGVTGTLATAFLTGKATFKAAKLIQAEEHRRALLEPAIHDALPVLDTKEKAKIVWKCFVPPAVSVVTTIGCIVGANTINTSRMAALAAAYAVSDKNFAEYKNKVKEVFGEKKENDVRASIAQDSVNASPPPGGAYIHNAAGGDTLCKDAWTGRYFYSDMQTLRAAENDLAKGMYVGQDAATLGDFYDAIRVPSPKCANLVGWNNDAPLKLQFDTVMAPGDVPCLVMDFANAPFPLDGYFGHA